MPESEIPSPDSPLGAALRVFWHIRDLQSVFPGHGHRRPREIEHRIFAKRLGVTPEEVRAAFNRGTLPGAKEHTESILMIPSYVLKLALVYGLAGVEWIPSAWQIFGPPLRDLPPAALATTPEVSAPTRIQHTDFARWLGIGPFWVRSAFERGGLPGAVAHSARRIMVPVRYLRLAEKYGLLTVERWARAGKFPEPGRPASDQTPMRLPFELPPAREVAAVACRRWKGSLIRHADFARQLGIEPSVVRAAYKRRGLPGSVEQSAHVLMIPSYLLRLADRYGLAVVESLAKAGIIAEDYDPEFWWRWSDESWRRVKFNEERPPDPPEKNS